MAEGQEAIKKVTDIDAATVNVKTAVDAFVERFAAMPAFAIGVDAMDQRQLRDAMGLRATVDIGDPWPKAEQLLLQSGFKWHWLGGTRVMYVQERDSFILAGLPDGDGEWAEAEEIND